MKILFICGSLEPGKDGVGDYVEVLSKRLGKLEHEVFKIALHDRFLKCDFKDQEGQLRISDQVRWPEKEQLCSMVISKFSPDVISFHFVPFAYSKKGILMSVLTYLKRILRGRPLHLMFHELWVEGRSFKSLVLSFLQRITILRLIRKLGPKYIHTSNEYYQHRLLKYGVNSKLYPVFSNVPLCYDMAYVRQAIDQKLGVKKECNVPFFLCFGSIHSGGEWDVLMDTIVSNYEKAVIISVGIVGRNGNLIWRKLKEEHNLNIQFIELGYVRAEELSYLLYLSDFGITTNPEVLLKKSGSVAAFIVHGTPVIYLRKDYADRTFQPCESNIPDLCFHISFIQKCGFEAIRKLKRPPINDFQPEKTFINDVLNF